MFNMCKRAAVLAVVVSLMGAGAGNAAEAVSLGGFGPSGSLERPRGQPVGSIILLAGGDGALGIGPGGEVTRLRGNQLIRTRERYAAAGFATLSLDAVGSVSAAIEHMARIRRPVVIVATSRGTLRAAQAIAGGARPDALVLTAGFLSPESGGPSVQSILGSPSSLPRTLVIHHRRDQCRVTLPAGVEPFERWAGSRVRVRWLDGGTNAGDACEARAYHGFNGLDGQVVAAVTSFARGR
jgi:hypothetical protein